MKTYVWYPRSKLKSGSETGLVYFYDQRNKCPAGVWGDRCPQRQAADFPPSSGGPWTGHGQKDRLAVVHWAFCVSSDAKGKKELKCDNLWDPDSDITYDDLY